MPDISTISALLSNVKTAIDIAKLVKDSDLSLEGAEIKLKMADLISTLADAKIELADVQDALREKDQKIKNLEAILLKKEATTFDGKMYWVKGDKTPFCAICHENDDKYIHLTYIDRSEYDSSESWYCHVCQTSFYP